MCLEILPWAVDNRGFFKFGALFKWYFKYDTFKQRIQIIKIYFCQSESNGVMTFLKLSILNQDYGVGKQEFQCKIGWGSAENFECTTSLATKPHDT